MTIRRLLPIIVLVLLLALVAAVLPTFAQDGQPQTDCPDCPVSFEMPSILDPGSRGAAEISQLFWVVTGIAAVVFVLVEALLLFSILRFRNRPASEAQQIHGNTKLELAWTIVPAIILAVLLGFTLRSMANVRTPQPGEPLNIKVIGHQWWWEFQYPDYGIKTANQLWVPVDRPINIELQSVDVQHGFWAPQLFGKMDAVPGHLNKLTFYVTDTGEYGAQCTQMCGIQHAQMRFSVIAVSASDFSTWTLAQSGIPAAPPADNAAATRGQQAFLEKCAACHAVNGTAAGGAVGPNLTHLHSREFIAGGVLALTDDNLKLWIKNPQAIKEGTIMPNLGLDDATVSDIVAYLSTLQ